MPLVLTRKESQSIQIGEATVTIKYIKARQVCVSIDAPKTVDIIRSELLDLSETQDTEQA